MIEKLARTLIDESVQEMGVQINDLTIVDEQKFVNWAKGKLDAILTVDKPVVKQSTEYTYCGLKLSDAYCRPFSFDRMTDTYHFKGHQAKESSFSLFDIKLLIMLEQEYNMKSWTELGRITGLNLQVIERIIYNLRSGFFEEWLDYVPKFSKEYGLLYIDGNKTDVPIRTVKYIVNCLADSSTPIQTLLKLEKAKECPRWIYRVIGTNYKNKELASLFDKPIAEIENNPEKRKENGL